MNKNGCQEPRMKRADDWKVTYHVEHDELCCGPSYKQDYGGNQCHGIKDP
jgi:hypothetical protein